MDRKTRPRPKAVWFGAFAIFLAAGLYAGLGRNASSAQGITPLPEESALFTSLNKDFSKIVVGPSNPIRLKRSFNDESITITFSRRGGLVDEVEDVVLKWNQSDGSLVRRVGSKTTTETPVCEQTFSRVDISWDRNDETKLNFNVCSRNRDAKGKLRGPTFSWKLNSAF